MLHCNKHLTLKDVYKLPAFDVGIIGYEWVYFSVGFCEVCKKDVCVWRGLDNLTLKPLGDWTVIKPTKTAIWLKCVEALGQKVEAKGVAWVWGSHHFHPYNKRRIWVV